MAIRVGLIGFGLSGRVFHVPFVMNDPDMTMTYVCSSKAGEVRAILPDVSVVSSAESVFAAPDVDLVVITTPNALHFDQAKQALESGKHVLLEKPSVTRLSQIEALCDLARQKGLVFCVYQNRRFDGDFLRLKALIESGELGELKHLDSRFDRFRPRAQARWREEPGVGTGIFWDLGPHILDQALNLFGPPKWLHASIDKLRDGSQTHDWFEVELGYDDKRIRLASTPFEAGDMRRFNARFTKGSWQCVGLDPQEEALRAGQMPWDVSFPSKATQQKITRFVAHSQEDIESIQETATQGDYTAFYAQLRNAILGKGEAPVAMEHACQLIYLICLAEQSAESGQRMSWSYTLNTSGE
ncbi:oxidoreductase [Marinomonas rhizomae]|uniref:Putative dehydrogenase n=1 Tax=Marinomonas rhizomae TaxID=491948 RepID=A0A366JHA1_9GAMM|nr:Gfo/Idh/MocA family oxidoreductase [Marinomonas rhizomae]RBP85198.1 putative dehydrogenase [Marinomonas rhizomae]RNF76302.1 oxidoreductase [Marinomonas rhizomae]